MPIGRASRKRSRRPARTRRRPTGSDGHVGPGAVVGRLVVGIGDHDPERFAPAARAVDLDEGDVVAAGEDADPVGRDELAAGGAVDAVGERVEVVARIHRRQV